jgi:hypothetical protein
MRRYLREDMKDELGELYEPLKLLETIHAAVWMEFDPTMELGDKKQPADIKVALQEIVELFEDRGLCIEGFEHEGEDVE